MNWVYSCTDCLKQTNEYKEAKKMDCGVPSSQQIKQVKGTDFVVPHFTSEEALIAHRQEVHGY
jgi:hypothetical protein